MSQATGAYQLVLPARSARRLAPASGYGCGVARWSLDERGFEANLRALASEMEGMPLRSMQVGAVGHASGEEWAKPFGRLLKKHFPETAFRHFEYLNHLLAANATKTTVADRTNLLGSDIQQYLLKRSDPEMKHWRGEAPFVEKQDDTADFLVVASSLEFIDLKSRNMAKRSQAPNLISGYKLAQVCKLLRDGNSEHIPNLWYVGVDWKWDAATGAATCGRTHVCNIRRANPKKLYINFTAGSQIQVHLDRMDQSFIGTDRQWATEFCAHYSAMAAEHHLKFEKRHILQFAAPD